jgi:hypothetical protein
VYLLLCSVRIPKYSSIEEANRRAGNKDGAHAKENRVAYSQAIKNALQCFRVVNMISDSFKNQITMGVLIDLIIYIYIQHKKLPNRFGESIKKARIHVDRQ